jgi:hypothetical protein
VARDNAEEERVRATLVLLLGTLAMAPGAGAQLGPLPPLSMWREYREIEDGFIVRVPNAVKAREWSDGGHPAGHYLTGNPQQAFSVIAVRWPAGLRGGRDAEAVLDDTVKRILAAMKAEKVDANEPKTCDGAVPGRILQARLAESLVYGARICVTSGNIYRVEAIVEAALGPDAEANAKAFLESFQPLRR